MNAYLWLPLLSGLACLAFAVLIVAREPWATTNRLTGLVLAGGAWWGCCEALWTVAPDAGAALYLVRLSTPGWAFVGPLALHLLLDQAPGGAKGLRRLVLSAYAVAGLGLAAEWAAPSLHSGAVPVAWGWGYQPTRTYAVWYVCTIGCVLLGGYYALARLRTSGSPAERGQSPWLQTALGVPVLLGSVTDGLLPLLGVQVPRLGVASFATLGGIIAWSIHRFGYSVLAPGTFAAPILASLRDGVVLATPEGRIRFANPGLAALLELPVAELAEQPLERFLRGAPLAPLRELSEVECELTGAARGPVPVALSTSLLRDRRGMLIGVVLVIRDLREVVGLRTRLLTSARLAAVGQLAAGIAHEINNPLAYIGANLRALREQWLAVASSSREAGAPRAPGSPAGKPDLDDLLEEGVAMLEESLEGVDRTAAIVRDVRVFSHGGSEAQERLEPNELVERALRVAEPHVRRRARVERVYEDVPPVVGSRRELEQVLLNLIINGAQAIEGEGTLRVATARRGEEVEIAVSDTGCGIPAEVIERIFDPFFTTKPVGEGTGLGLSISYEIVRRHGGRILVESEVGRGTEVRVRLPAAAGRGEA
jgi:signal transduction histidine kinase